VDIYVSTGEISGKALKNTISSLNDSIKSLRNIENTILNARFVSADGYATLLFPSKYGERLTAIRNSLDELENRLTKYSSIMGNGPEELAEIDRNCKNEISTWSERIGFLMGGGIGAMFHPRGAKSTGVSIVRPDYTGPYPEIVEDFSWQDSKATNEQIQAAVETGMKKAMENNGSPSEYIRAELQALYEATKIKGIPAVRDANDGVKRGEITYRDQSHENGDGNSDYWGKYYPQSGGECMIACASMALSYIGIDATPEELLDSHNGESYWGGYEEGETSVPGGVPNSTYGTESANIKMTADKMLSNYMEDDSASISPVIIGYSSPGGKEHKLLIIGKEGDKYIAVDPWNNSEPIKISIDNNGVVTSETKIPHLDDKVNLMLDSVWQYELKQ